MGNNTPSRRNKNPISGGPVIAKRLKWTLRRANPNFSQKLATLPNQVRT
jgi:hypothetical protein